MGADRMSLRMAALAAGLAAKAGTLDPADVARLDGASGALLEEDDALRISIADFVAGHDERRRDPDALAELGDALVRAVELDAYTPPDLHRSDIYG